MRRPKRWTLPLAFALLALSAAFAGRAQQGGELAIEEVAGGVFMITGPGGNVGLSVGEDGALLVDDKFARNAEGIEELVEGKSEGPLRFLLNTHWHGDHTGGNAHFGKLATILAHTNVRRRLAGDETVGGRVQADAAEAALPVLTYDEGVSLHFNGQEISVQHYPEAHTDGDSVVTFHGANVVHVGDILFNRMFPFIDLDSGGSLTGYLSALKEIHAGLPEGAKIIPGHGELAAAEDVQATIDMLEEVESRVSAALDEGKSAGQMLEEGLIADYADWSWAFITTERFLEMVAADLNTR